MKAEPLFQLNIRVENLMRSKTKIKDEFELKALQNGQESDLWLKYWK